MNSFTYRKILTPRRLRIQYVSPPICDGDFSATGSSAISLLPLLKSLGPSGLIMEPWFGRYRLRWNTVPGAICYTVYKLADEIDPFGAYTIVAECIPDAFYDVDDGIYCVTAITPEGETDCGNIVSTPAEPPLPPLPPYVPEDPPVVPPVPSPVPPPDIPGTCGDGTPPVPASLLVELPAPEIVTSVVGSGGAAGSVSFTMPSGKLVEQWVGGTMWQNCLLYPPPYNAAVCGEQINSAWIVHNGDVTVMGPDLGCTNFGIDCVGGGNPTCTPPVATQWAANWPDGIVDTYPGMTLYPYDPRVGTSATFTVPALGLPPGADPSVTQCPAGGQVTMNLLRTHGWLPQKSSLTIFNFAARKLNIFCQGSGPTPAGQWDGIIADDWGMGETDYWVFEYGGGVYVGNCLLTQVYVGLNAGYRWEMSIVGDYGDGPTLLWSGEKRYGEDATGEYGRNGGCSGEGCVILI